MPLTTVVPKRTGRPRAAEGTVRIMKSGVARLSPDLCIGTTFTISADNKKKKIVLRRFNDQYSTGRSVYSLWYSSGAAKSGLISFTSAIKVLGLGRIDGIYAAKKTKDTITIDLTRKLGV